MGVLVGMYHGHLGTRQFNTERQFTRYQGVLMGFAAGDDQVATRFDPSGFHYERGCSYKANDR